MKAKKCLKWLVVALVAAAGMVLLGCPHNNLIENEVLGSNTASERGGSSGVQLVITNFVTSTAQTGRSANSWLNPLRTVSPEHIDLTVKDRIEEYIFVASGVGDGGSYGPKLVDIAETTGIAVLPDIGNGYWDITIDAYSVEKLKVANVAFAGQNKSNIMQTPEGEIQSKIVDHKTSAVVLSGQAGIHLGNNTKQVTLTLTSSSEAEYGDVNIAIHFPDTNDKSTIFDPGSSYKVKARLVNPLSMETIMGQLAAGGVSNQTSEVTLFDNDIGVDAEAPLTLTGYVYNIYKDGNYSKETLQTNNGKLLSYRPSPDPANPTALSRTDAYKFPVGKYMLLVEIETPTGEKIYASDPEFFVEGNRTTTGVFTINKLLGEDPKKPLGLEVYYSTPSITNTLIGYNATFKWGPDVSDFAAVGYELEIADITDIYVNDGNQSKIKTLTVLTGKEFNNSDLWSTILDQVTEISEDDRKKYVTTISWMDQTKNSKYPWQGGSLLLGKDTITLGLQAGHVYSARIRSTNGYKNSEWTYLGTGTMQNGTVVSPPATKFAHAETNGIFNLVTIAYKLTDVDMYTLAANRDSDFKVISPDDNKVTSLLEAYEYDPTNREHQLQYSFEGQNVTAKKDDQVLVAKGNAALDIVRSWQGWQNENTPTETFGPVNSQTSKTDWKYSGFKSVTLVPVGSGGSSLKVEVHTADTTNVLGLETVGFSTSEPTTGSAKKVTVSGLTVYATSSPRGIYRNTAGNELVLVLDAIDSGQRANDTTDLFVAIGDSNIGVVKDTLTDKNGKTISVSNLVVELRNGINKYKTTSSFVAAEDGANPAYAKFDNVNPTSKLGGVAPRKYTLYVQMTTGNYTQSIQIPVTILYTYQTVSITSIP